MQKKASGKIHCPFKIEISVNVDLKGNTLNLKQHEWRQQKPYFVLQSGPNTAPKMRNQAEMSLLIISTQCCSGGPRKYIKHELLRTHEVKLSLFAADLIMYTEILRNQLKATRI